MPLSVESTRYSLVKGERIVRFVLTTWLREFLGKERAFIYTTPSAAHYSEFSDVGL